MSDTSRSKREDAGRRGRALSPAGEEESVEAQVDVVQMAGKYLKERHDKDGSEYDTKTMSFRQRLPKASGEHYDPESAYTISPFLGDKNWSRRKVSDLISLKGGLHPLPYPTPTPWCECTCKAGGGGQGWKGEGWGNKKSGAKSAPIFSGRAQGRNLHKRPLNQATGLVIPSP